MLTADIAVHATRRSIFSDIARIAALPTIMARHNDY
jgi:hypothetical protein